MPALWFYPARTVSLEALLCGLGIHQGWIPLGLCPYDSAGTYSQLAPTFIKTKVLALRATSCVLSPNTHIQKF